MSFCLRLALIFFFFCVDDFVMQPVHVRNLLENLCASCMYPHMQFDGDLLSRQFADSSMRELVNVSGWFLFNGSQLQQRH